MVEAGKEREESNQCWYQTKDREINEAGPQFPLHQERRKRKGGQYHQVPGRNTLACNRRRHIHSQNQAESKDDIEKSTSHCLGNASPYITSTSFGLRLLSPICAKGPCRDGSAKK